KHQPERVALQLASDGVGVLLGSLFHGLVDIGLRSTETFHHFPTAFDLHFLYGNRGFRVDKIENNDRNDQVDQGADQYRDKIGSERIFKADEPAENFFGLHGRNRSQSYNDEQQ